MSKFTALNIEPDDQSDDEVDNTKEIQIEEALKLFQAALKLHSQGPSLYHQAYEAYDALFKSEIFKYPESDTEFSRVDANPLLEYTEASFAMGLDPTIIDIDGVPSTLPQILYLSYKNYGQFVMDRLKYDLHQRGGNISAAIIGEDLEPQAKVALQNFARALAADESDTELWRRAAKVGALLGSRRILRYCLEAAVEVDDDPTVAEVDPASIEEGFAGEQLKQQLQILSDETSLSHPIMGPFIKRSMAPALTKFMEPYSYFPDPTKQLALLPLEGDRIKIEQPPLMVEPVEANWLQLGITLFDHVAMANGSFSSAQVIIKTNTIAPAPELTLLEASAQAMPTSLELVQADDQVMAEASASPAPIPVSAPAHADDEVMKDVATPDPTGESSTGVTNPATSTPVEQDERNGAGSESAAASTSDAQPQQIVLPNRKRSQSAAGLRETPEDDNATQKRSKRIRNRDTAEVDPATLLAEQRKPYFHADTELYRFAGNILTKLGIDDLGSFEETKAAFLQDPAGDDERIQNTAMRDLRDILKTWDDSKASTYTNSNPADILGSVGGGSVNAGIAAFLEHSNSGPIKIASQLPPQFSVADGFEGFVQKINDGFSPLQDVIYGWVHHVLRSYAQTLWQEDLKVNVVKLICWADADLYNRLKLEIDKQDADQSSEESLWLEEMVQTLFELHLDVYSRITNPSSIVSYDTRLISKDRLDRWADFSADVIRSREREPKEETSLRYLWASVFYATMAEGVSREHKVLCWSDLKALLQESGSPVIELQNNAVMPEISDVAAEREVNRLTTMDFFFNLFRTDNSDPLAIIETLEPVLDPDSAMQKTVSEIENDTTIEIETDNTSASLRDMWKFLKGSTSLRLFLWQRLREAYIGIDYNTKVFSCHLKSLEIIVSHLRTEEHVNSADNDRQHKLLMWLKALDELLVKSLSMALNDADKCFEIIDERHIKSTCASLAQLSRILHSAAFFDDEIKLGVTQLPNKPAYGERGNFSTFMTKLREMQVRTWALQYTLIKEGIVQNQELFPDMDHELADYLAVVHYAFGLRKFCKNSNKIFLKMMKVEMIRMKHVDRWEDYLGQVLFDLYGLRLGVGTYLLDDHGCPPESLDRRTALNIAERVIHLANQMPLKDLIKHELKPTIEKMQTAIGPTKSTPQMQHNLRNYTEYLKTSIRPMDMYKALKGQVQVDSLPIVKVDTSLADQGWYFLLGMIHLTKFRQQKRLAPGTQQDDLRVGATFMRLQLQFTADQWETWYRLAQCFDLELEEEVLWTADKINNHSRQLLTLQRSAIHCYIMALSTAVRTADDSFETAAKLSEMYHDFGMRIYASSREPFENRAFWVDEYERHMSGEMGMYRRPAHDEMGKYKVWKYAANLFRKALADKPKYWMNHYMLGKCLWKLYCKAPIDDKDRASRPDMWDPLQSFIRAVETAPKQKDSRSELTLEPHYKLMSTVHKLVIMKDMEPQAGADLLQRQPFAIRKGEEIKVKDHDEWEAYILECFRHIRNADKSHWHHRMISRVVNILYDPETPDYIQATAARHEFRESILTKTMHVQVWKPEAERPGRHHVYMERYVRFIIKLLYVLNDKVGLEGLAKRVRKRAGDYYQFSIVWQECCMAYLKLIRKSGTIPPNMEEKEIFKGVSREEFETFSQRLAVWMTNPELKHPALDALREAVELKKLNQNLMKGVSIDDAIHDAYAVLYSEVAGGLPGPEPVQHASAIPQVDGEAAFRSQGPMSLNNLVMNMEGPPVPGISPGLAAPMFLGPNSEPAPHPRRVGIRRTEVIKKAEAAIAKVAEVPRPPVSASSRPSVSQPAVVLEPNAAPLPPASTPPRPAYSDLKESEAKDDSSAPGSVHDSADDESDLSDVPDMDDADEASIFPNLVSRETNTGADSSGGEEDGDDEEEEEEGEEEEEEVEQEEEEEDSASPRKDSDTNMEG